MSSTLEGSGFTEEQPAAIIETVALAIETFGVTPEILDDRINKVMDFVREQIADVKTEGKGQYGELKAQIADVKTEGQKQYEELKAQIADIKAEGRGQVGDVKEQLQDFKAEAKSQFEILTAQVTANSIEIKGIQQSIDGLKQGMLDHQRSMFRIMMTFMIALLAATLGVFGVLLQQFLLG